ncbi:hypothetical protein SAMN05216276_100416 [Streptosporangium subroseum]|uniref:DUF1795 domain-containing protein n=1 Tax=Streptosporangium subroseum TaxID=106412 RepID=A0A239BQ28_9ACTN|nr:hypothetical protein SAMN05216276_100416 [Streptosporangium subroseum]
MQWQRIEKPDFGYAVHVPQSWDERPPNLKNSPWETARFGDPTDRRHTVIVFRARTLPGWTAAEVAEEVQTSLRAAGFDDFRITDAQVSGRTGARLDCAKYDTGRVWAVRHYFVVHDDVRFTLGCGSFIPEEDDPLFAAMAERFEILNPV